eukprot:2230143-Rhodomonas_salina.1
MRQYRTCAMCGTEASCGGTELAYADRSRRWTSRSRSSATRALGTCLLCFSIPLLLIVLAHASLLEAAELIRAVTWAQRAPIRAVTWARRVLIGAVTCVQAAPTGADVVRQPPAPLPPRYNPGPYHPTPPYAVSGTHGGYAATSCLVLRAAMLLRGVRY